MVAIIRRRNGRKFRTANLKDDCTRECPAIEVDFSLPGERVVKLLERVARERGYRDILVVDNGRECHKFCVSGPVHAGFRCGHPQGGRGCLGLSNQRHKDR